MNTKIFFVCLLALTFNAHAIATTEKSIKDTQARIIQSPQTAALHVELSQLLAKRGRETANHDFYNQALKAANRALELAPKNAAAVRAKIWALLGKHEFLEARERAVELNKRIPDDILTYALLVDANVELGNYQEAEEAAQWLIDMRPGSIAGLTRAAYLRELYGDLEGSKILLRQALEKTTGNDSEQQAWLLVHLGQIQLQLGQIDLAEKITNHALEIYPAYHYALKTLVDIAYRKQNVSDALAFAKRFYESAPHPENLFVLANALKNAGQHEAASEAFEKFEREALDEADGWDNANRELVYFLVDETNNIHDALRIAEREYEKRQDIFTKTAYAWALLAIGDTDSAWQIISEALAVGTRSAEITLRAGLIANRAGKLDEAKRYLLQGTQDLPLHPLAAEAKRNLRELTNAKNLVEHAG